MRTKFRPLIIGLITGILMIVVVLILFYQSNQTNSPFQYIVYVLYVAGIIWTLISFRNSASFTGKFIDLFGQGFRCFIVITLVMVLFTGIFLKMHPEFAEQAAESYKKELSKKGDKTPDEIEEIITKGKKQYTVYIISVSIFGYLIVGAAATAIVSGFLTKRN